MPTHKYFVKDSVKKAELDEFLFNELKNAGYSRVELTKTPLGTRVVIYASKPGMVIGRRGQSIRDLSKILEERFGVENPQISVAPIEVPELDPRIVASQIATALQKGIHFRRAAYWAIQRVMGAGASGVEIVISGKLTTERARYEKYRAGYLPRIGNHVSKQIRTAVAVTQLKPGLYGVRVSIVPPSIKLPDKPEIKQPVTTSSSSITKEEGEKLADTEET
ncbi:MAG: 30S ribosomal protein S3 [Candidatus Bathyarchaeia archaeon]